MAGHWALKLGLFCIASCAFLADYLTRIPTPVVEHSVSSIELVNNTIENSSNYELKPVRLDQFGDLINDGKSVLDLIRGGTKVTHTGSDWPSAVPTRCIWEEMTGWHRSGSVHRQRYHSVVVDDWKILPDYERYDIQISWRFDYGGSCNGAGQYLHAVQLDVEKIWLAWVWSADLSVVADSPINIGTFEAPVASLTFTKQLRISNIAVTSFFTEHSHITITGDGRLEEESSPIMLAGQPTLSTPMIIGVAAMLAGVMAAWCPRASSFSTQDGNTPLLSTACSS